MASRIEQQNPASEPVQQLDSGGLPQNQDFRVMDASFAIKTVASGGKKPKLTGVQLVAGAAAKLSPFEWLQVKKQIDPPEIVIPRSKLEAVIRGYCAGLMANKTRPSKPAGVGKPCSGGVAGDEIARAHAAGLPPPEPEEVNRRADDFDLVDPLVYHMGFSEQLKKLVIHVHWECKPLSLFAYPIPQAVIEFGFKSREQFLEVHLARFEEAVHKALLDREKRKAEAERAAIEDLKAKEKQARIAEVRSQAVKKRWKR